MRKIHSDDLYNVWRISPYYKELSDSRKLLVDIVVEQREISYENLFMIYKKILAIDLLEKEEFNNIIAILMQKGFIYSNIFDPSSISIEEPLKKGFQNIPDLTKHQRCILTLLCDYGSLCIEELIAKYERVYLGTKFDDLDLDSESSDDLDDNPDLDSEPDSDFDKSIITFKKDIKFLYSAKIIKINRHNRYIYSSKQQFENNFITIWSKSNSNRII